MTSYSLDKDRLDSKPLTLFLHLLRRLEPVEVIDGYIAALLGKGGGYEGAEPAVCGTVFVSDGSWLAFRDVWPRWAGLRGATRNEHVAAFEIVWHGGFDCVPMGGERDGVGIMSSWDKSE
jgi:hypothetical protein